MVRPLPQRPAPSKRLSGVLEAPAGPACVLPALPDKPAGPLEAPAGLPEALPGASEALPGTTEAFPRANSGVSGAPGRGLGLADVVLARVSDACRLGSSLRLGRGAGGVGARPASETRNQWAARRRRAPAGYGETGPFATAHATSGRHEANFEPAARRLQNSSPMGVS